MDVAAKLGIPLLRAPQFSNVDSVAAGFEEYTAKLREYGHDPAGLDQPVAIRIYVAPTDEEAKPEAEHALWWYKLLATLLPGAPGRTEVPKGYEDYPADPNELINLTLEDVWERGTAFGSPERVTEEMNQYMHKLGVNNFILWNRIGGLEHKKIIRSMELFAEHVMPAVRAEEARMAAAE